MFRKHRTNLLLAGDHRDHRRGASARPSRRPTPSTHHAGNQLGYGTQIVSGAHVTSMHYMLSADGTTVNTVTFVAAGDLTAGVPPEHGFVGFTVGGTPGTTVDCGTGVLRQLGTTTFTCDVTTLAQAVATIQSTDIAVTN